MVATVFIIIAIIIAAFVVGGWLYTIWVEKIKDKDRADYATQDFGESCESTDECLIAASADNQVRLECFMIEGEGTCLTSSIDHCTAFDIDIRGAIYNECTACEAGFTLANGRCVNNFHCPDGYEFREENGVPGCY